MDLQRLTIGQMAQLNHVSEQTLRLYDREGILKAQEVDPESGYRYYHILQSARLDLIQNMKTYGLTLKQIRDMLDNDDTAVIRKKLEVQAQEIQQQLEQLFRVKNTLRRVLDNYKKYEALPKNGQIFLEYQPARRIYSFGCEQDFFEQDEAGYEYMLRQLKQHLVHYHISLSLFCNIGTIIRRKRLERAELISNEVFLFVDEDSASGITESYEMTPAATYVCMCFDDFEKEAEHARKLLQYIRENGYQIAGDYICEAIIDFPVLEKKRRHIFSKIQIPVIFEK